MSHLLSMKIGQHSELLRGFRKVYGLPRDHHLYQSQGDWIRHLIASAHIMEKQAEEYEGQINKLKEENERLRSIKG